jgi:hypothetical protein
MPGQQQQQQPAHVAAMMAAAAAKDKALQEQQSKSKKSKSKPAVEEHHDNECVVCMERSIEVMLLPCKCFKLCTVCSDDIREKNQPCPWCRRDVDRHMRVRK